jgi:molybdate transport system substrate-binding protein
MRSVTIKLRLFSLALSVFSAIFAGCGKIPASSEKHILHIYAGAGLRCGIDAVAAEFAKKTGVTVEVDYGGSGMITSRAQEDPNADLFIPGDVWYVNRLQLKANLIEERKNIAHFVPLIITAKHNPKNITELKDLFRDDVKVAIGNPETCQIGRLTLEILKKNNMDPKKLRAKKSLTVNELGVWVRMRDVDTAVVWNVTFANIADDVARVAIPEKDNIISRVVIGLLRTSSNKKSAREFMDFISGRAGKRILREKGFDTKI